MKTSITICIRGIFMTLVTLTVITCQTKGPVVNTDADKAAIRKVVEKGLDMVTKVNKDNASEFVRFFYTEDAIIFPPNALPIKGLEAITGLLQNYPPMTDYKQKPEEILVFGDYAYLWETWSVTLPASDNEGFKDTGTMFWIFRKQNDGSWKLWREIWHSDLPLPGGTSTSKQ